MTISEAENIIKTFEKYGGFSGLFSGYSYMKAVPDPALFTKEELKEKAERWGKYYLEYGDACANLKRALEFLIEKGVIRYNDLSPEYRAIVDGRSVQDVIRKTQQENLVAWYIGELLKAGVSWEEITQTPYDELVKDAKKAKEQKEKEKEQNPFGSRRISFNSLISGIDKSIKTNNDTRYVNIPQNIVSDTDEHEIELD